MLVFKNGHGSSITVTIEAQAVARTIAGLGAGSFTLPDISVAIAAGATKTIYLVGNIAGYIDSNGYVQITYASGNAALTVVPLKIS
jgi:hypothetical protein